jgi:hypothetical protein
MHLPVIEMEKEQAQEAFREYRDAIRAGPRDKFLEVRREYEAMDRAVMRGYKEIAKGNSLLRLSETIHLGGTQQLTWTDQRWRNNRWENVTYVGTFPRLAITRADARRCVCSGVLPDGTVRFNADGGRSKIDTVRLEHVFGRPEHSATQEHEAIVPTIPPMFRPPHKLSGYHLLWEAEWDLAAPVDPALLKHLGGDLYAVLAVWDLTELERAVLAGRGE